MVKETYLQGRSSVSNLGKFFHSTFTICNLHLF
jgi:hypothetical protein